MNDMNLELNHAFESASLILDIRSALERNECIADVLTKLGQRVGEICEHTPEKYLPDSWRIVASGLSVLVSKAKCVAIAHGAAGDLIFEQARRQELLTELRAKLSSESLVIPSALDEMRERIIRSADAAADDIRSFLSRLPLPTIYLYRKLSEDRLPLAKVAEPSDGAPSPLIRVIVFLDHAPLVTPQLVKAALLYPLAFRLRGLTWPDGAQRLHLDLLTTCPASEFATSIFTVARPATIRDFEYEAEVSGHINFNAAQSSLLEDLVFAVRAAFELSDGMFQEIPVIGHHELRLRVTDQQNHPLMTGNRRLDRHVEELVTKLLKDCPQVSDELNDLLQVLEALTFLLAAYAQEAMWKGRSDVPESEFQRTVQRDLRMRLGPDVQEHPNQAGGIPDIRFRGVIVELKVENQSGEREHICRKYTEQPTQYSGAEARQVSVVLVLDLTTKDKPPGDIRNDILLADVETHGGDSDSKPFPSKAFVFVVNGNMKSPSDYSR